MTEYRISNKEADILSKVKPTDEWRTLKEASMVGNLISGLGIYEDEIGTRCASHLKRIAKKKYTTIEHIIKGCPTLKKHLEGSKEGQHKREKERKEDEITTDVSTTKTTNFHRKYVKNGTDR